MSVFRSCPSTNDLSESYVASAKYEKKRSIMADWDTVESTTIMRRNNTKEYFQNLRNNDENTYNKAMELLSSTTQRELIESHKNHKTQVKTTKALIAKEKIEKQKALLRYQQQQKEKAWKRDLLSLEEIDEQLKSSQYVKSKTKRLLLLKEQLTTYKVKYSNLKLDGFPKIQFSYNREPLTEQQLLEMLKKCIEIVDNYEQNNQNEIEYNTNNSNNNNVYIGQKRMREYNVNNPKSKKIRIIGLPNIDYSN